MVETENRNGNLTHAIIKVITSFRGLRLEVCGTLAFLSKFCKTTTLLCMHGFSFLVTFSNITEQTSPNEKILLIF